jgi:hypothetical protein
MSPGVFILPNALNGLFLSARALPFLCVFLIFFFARSSLAFSGLFLFDFMSSSWSPSIGACGYWVPWGLTRRKQNSSL